MTRPPIYAVRRVTDDRWELVGPDDDPRPPPWQRWDVMHFGTAGSDRWQKAVRTRVSSQLQHLDRRHPSAVDHRWRTLTSEPLARQEK
jgi:hypothetical protein